MGDDLLVNDETSNVGSDAALLDAVFENYSNPVVLVKEGNVFKGNQKALHLLGIKDAKWISLPIWKIFDFEFPPSNIAATHPPSGEKKVLITSLTGISFTANLSYKSLGCSDNLVWLMEFYPANFAQIANETVNTSLAFAKIGVWEYDTTTERIVLDNTASQIFELPVGFPPTIESFFNFFDKEEDCVRIKNIFTGLAENQSVFDERLCIVTANGKKKKLRITGNARFLDYIFVGISGLVHENGETGLPHTGNGQHTSKYKFLFDQNPEPVFTLGQDGSILEVNDPMSRLTGIKVATIDLGIYLFDLLVGKSSAPHNSELLKGIFLGNIKYFATEILSLDGKKYSVDITFIPIILDEGIKCVFGKITDNTVTKETEKVLVRSVEMLEETNNIARVGGYEVDVLAGRATWSKTTKEIFGIPMHWQPSLDEVVSYFKEGTDRNAMRSLLQDAIEQGTAFDTEAVLTQKDGRDIWIRVTGNPEIIDNKCTRFFGIIQDIDHLKRIKDELENERTLLRSLIDNLPIAVFVKDHKARKLIANKLDLIFSGFDNEVDVIGKTDVELFTHNKKHNGYLQDKYVLQYGNPVVESPTELISRWGDKRMGSVSKYPLKDKDGKVTGIIGMARDVTLENQIQSHLKLVEFIFKRAAVSIFIINEDSSFYDMNDMACKILGYSKTEMISMSVEDINPEYSHEVWPDHWKELRAKGSMEFTSIEKKKDGSIFPVIIRANIIKYQDRELNCAFVSDISELTKIEAELAKNLLRYEQVTLATSEVIWEHDFVGKQFYISKNFNEFFGHTTVGYQPEENNIWFRNVHPEDLDRINKETRENIFWHKNEKFETKYRLRKADGNYLWVSDRYFAIYDKDGEPIKLVGAIKDIDNEKKNQEALQIAKTRFENASIATSDVVWEADLKLGTLFLSDNFTKIFGHTVSGPEDGNDNIWIRNVHPDDRSFVLKDAEMAIIDRKMDRWSNEYRIKKSNGEYAWVVDRASVILDDNGAVVSLVGAIQDITEKKQQEEEVRKNIERYKIATLATSDAIWEADLLNGTLFLGPNFSLIFGHEREDVFVDGSINPWSDNVHPDDKETVLLFVGSVIESDQVKWTNEYRLRKKSGEYALVTNRGYVVRDESGKAIRLIGAMQDITQKKAEEERLKLLETVVVNCQDSILITNVKALENGFHPIVYVNDSFTRIYGFERDEVIGQSPWMLLPGPENDRARENELKNALAEKRHFVGEFNRFTKDGHSIWLSSSIAPVFDSQGEVTHWVAIQRDITEQKKSFNEFVKLSNLQTSILGSTNFSIITTDVNGTITSFNSGAERMLGYKAEEMIGIKTPEVIHDKDEVIRRATNLGWELGQYVEPGFSTFIVKAKSGISDENEWTYIAKDGKRVPVSLIVSSLYDEKGIVFGYLGVAKDLSEEKKMRADLKMSKEALAETSNELEQQKFAIDQHSIVAITDVQGSIVYANDNFCTISQFSRSELLGKNHRIIKSGYHDDFFFKEMYHTIANGRVWKGEICNKAKDGSLYWVDTTIVPYIDILTKKPIRYISIRTDITQRKKVEIEREMLVEELTHHNMELKQFSYITTHNLRAPLTNLMSICRLINMDTIKDSVTIKLVNGFKVSTQHLNETLADLIDMLIIKENKNLPLDTVMLETVLAKVLTSLQFSFEKKNAQINFDFSKAPSVKFYPSYLESIFLNLITNSLKYSSPERNPILKVNSEPMGSGGVRIVYSDNGLGMDMAKVRHKIFGLYQRFHTNADSKGIGLYLIHSQVTSLGGKIEVESELNVGTTFSLTFK